MNEIMNENEIEDFMNLLDNSLPFNGETERLDFRYYNKLTYEQESKAFYIISSMLHHFTTLLTPIFGKKEITLSRNERRVLTFKGVKEELESTVLSKEFRLDNEQIFLSLPKKSVNILLNREEETSLDKIASFAINKYFFAFFPSSITSEYSGEVSTEEDVKEVLSEKLGDEKEEQKEEIKVIKGKYGDSNIYYAYSFIYDCDTYPLTINLYFSYQSLLKLLHEEKYIGELHSPSFYKKDNVFAVLCSGKIDKDKISSIKIGSLLKFKTSIDEDIRVYKEGRLEALSYCEKVHDDFYTIAPLEREIEEKQNTDDNTYLCLSIMNNDIDVHQMSFLTDTRVSQALPLIVEGKIIALALPLCIEDKFAAKIVELVNPQIKID